MDNYLNLDLTKIPKELKIILDLINIQDYEEIKKIINGNSADIDWNLLLELACHHRVYPLVFSILKHAEENLIPSYIIQSLYQQIKTNTLKMLQLGSEMEVVDKILSEDNIRLIYLKGPILAKELYGDLSLRPSSDIDILVPIYELGRVDAHLLKNGYVQIDNIQSVLGDWKWRHHHIEYFHFQKNIKIEVHWRLNPGPGKEPTFNELWERKRESKIAGRELSFLGKEDLFFFLVSHGARHGWSRLRWLVDIDKIMKEGLDWGMLFKLLKKFGFLHIAGQAIILSSQLLSTPITKEIKLLKISRRSMRLAQGASFYFERMVNLHSPPVAKDIATYHKHHLFSLMSSQQKLLFVMSCLHPYPTDVETLPLPKNLHVLYFLLRPFLWAWRKTKYKAIP